MLIIYLFPELSLARKACKRKMNFYSFFCDTLKDFGGIILLFE